MGKKFGLYALCVGALAVILALGMTYPKVHNGWETVKVPGDVGAAQVERIGIMSQDDCYLYNGADIYGYSDRLSTQKYRINADAGDLFLSGKAWITGTLTQVGDGAFTSDVSANTFAASTAITIGTGSNGTLAVGGASVLTGNVNIPGILSSDTINILRLNENTVVTGTLAVSSDADLNGALSVAGVSTFESQARADNGLRVTQNITHVSGNAILNTVTVSGTLDVQGLVSSNAGNILQLNEATLVTGTLGVSELVTLAAQVRAENGFRVTQNITQVSGSFILNSGIVSGTLGVAGIGSFSSELYADNGLRVTGPITQVSGIAYLNSVAVTSTVKVGTFLQYTSGVTQSVITTQPITPTATYMQIAANDGDGCFTDNLLRVGALTGQLWILQNIGVPTITITDANTCNLASTYAMGISDTLALIFDGTTWNELYRSNN